LATEHPQKMLFGGYNPSHDGERECIVGVNLMTNILLCILLFDLLLLSDISSVSACYIPMPLMHKCNWKSCFGSWIIRVWGGATYGI